MRVRSANTDRVYDPLAMIYLENPLQIARYLKYGATLYDIYENNGVLVGVFSKRETADLYKKWKAHELE